MLPHLEDDIEDDVVRCQRVRQEYWKRFKTVGEMFEFLKQEDKSRIRRSGKSAVVRRSSVRTKLNAEAKTRTTKG